ncbi:hypothetical protein V6N13_043283 [Hibiscus sabdariffa]|uniref:Uncharacterized protein n=1 Tax=Hibiscus sabdariffa TaxID=183260 RepID=A0ABR2G224_9ROSI
MCFKFHFSKTVQTTVLRLSSSIRATSTALHFSTGKQLQNMIRALTVRELQNMIEPMQENTAPGQMTKKLLRVQMKGSFKLKASGGAFVWMLTTSSSLSHS